MTIERALNLLVITSAAVWAVYQTYTKVLVKRGKLRKDRRRAADEESDATEADLRDQVAYLLAEQKASRVREAEADRQLRAHLAWDRQVFTALAEAGIDVDPPPPLWRTT